MPAFIRSHALTAVLAALCVWLVFIAAGATFRQLAAKHELGVLDGQLADQQRGNDRLDRQVQRMRQPSWLALLARARLNWRSPDETVVFVYKSEKSDTIAPPQTTPDTRSNWRKWWDWLVQNE